MKIITTILITLLLTIETTTAKDIEPKVIRAYDAPRVTHRRVSRARNTQEDIILSTIDASSEISVQITSAMSLEASTEATSNEPQTRRARKRHYSELKFLKNNRTQITQNISQGKGEYLSTLLNIMNIKQTPSTLIKIQSNFDILSSLNNELFLSKLKKIGES